jgi:hypothetical protein
VLEREEDAFCCGKAASIEQGALSEPSLVCSQLVARDSLLDVEILWNQAIDRPQSRTILLKGFEDGRIHIWFLPDR